MLKIDQFECLICNRILEDPIELPCGFTCCTRHLVSPQIFEPSETLSILCFCCTKFHNFSTIGRSNIFENYFKRDNDPEVEKKFIEWLEKIRNLRYKLKLQFKIKTFDFDSLENLVDNEKEQILAELYLQVKKLNDHLTSQLDQIKNYSHYLIKILQQEKYRVCEKIKNKEIFDPQLIKEFDDLLSFFHSNPIIVNKNNYKQFIKKYKKLDSVSSAIVNTSSEKFDHFIKNFSFEINNDISDQFSLLDGNVMRNEVIEQENGRIIHHYHYYIIKMNFKLSQMDNPELINYKNSKKIFIQPNFEIEILLESKTYDDLGYLEFSLHFPEHSKENKFIELKLKNIENFSKDHVKYKFSNSKNTMDKIIVFKKFIKIKKLISEGFYDVNLDQIAIEILIH